MVIFTQCLLTCSYQQHFEKIYIIAHSDKPRGPWIHSDALHSTLASLLCPLTARPGSPPRGGGGGGTHFLPLSTEDGGRMWVHLLPLPQGGGTPLAHDRRGLLPTMERLYTLFKTHCC